MMAAAHRFNFNLMLTLVVVLSMHGGLCEAVSTMKTMSKGQISCKMCAACENPCQPPPPPYPSPPPPSPESYYCPPPPCPPTAPPSDYCPPPPASDTGGYYNSPPPPPQCSDVPSGGGEVIPLFPGPPNPLLPCFPFDDYCPPPPTDPNSVALRTPNSVFLVIILISFIFHI